MNPFRFGDAVDGEYFIGRYREKELLIAELSLGRSILLSSPPAHGKTSLAKKVMSEIEHRGIMTVYLELERAYSPSRFIEIYLSELLRAAFRQTKELRGFIQELDPEIKKNLLFKIEKNDELILDLNENSDFNTIANSVMELARYTVEYKKRPCVVCIDEITRGGNLPDVLRNHIFELPSLHPGVGYLLLSLEAQPKLLPKNVTTLALDKIEERYLKGYIKTRFENTGFRIVESIIDEILEMTNGHPQFTQMICRHLWDQSHSGKVISSKSITEAIETIMEVQSEFYLNIWSDLSLHQKNFLLAVCKGGGHKIFSQEYVSRFALGSFSTVQKSLNRLLVKKVLEKQGETYVIRDIFFQRWLLRRMA